MLNTAKEPIVGSTIQPLYIVVLTAGTPPLLLPRSSLSASHSGLQVEASPGTRMSPPLSHLDTGTWKPTGQKSLYPKLPRDLGNSAIPNYHQLFNMPIWTEPASLNTEMREMVDLFAFNFHPKKTSVSDWLQRCTPIDYFLREIFC